MGMSRAGDNGDLRFKGDAMKNNKAVITESEIQQALEKFKKHGGLIKRLPDEVVPAHNLVGAKWSMYETIQDSGAAATPSDAS
jgi:hypothetical protein